MNAAPVLIQIRGVSKSYDGVHALSDVSLDLAPAEIHAVCRDLLSNPVIEDYRVEIQP